MAATTSIWNDLMNTSEVAAPPGVFVGDGDNSNDHDNDSLRTTDTLSVFEASYSSDDSIGNDFDDDDDERKQKRRSSFSMKAAIRDLLLVSKLSSACLQQQHQQQQEEADERAAVNRKATDCWRRSLPTNGDGEEEVLGDPLQHTSDPSPHHYHGSTRPSPVPANPMVMEYIFTLRASSSETPAAAAAACALSNNNKPDPEGSRLDVIASPSSPPLPPPPLPSSSHYVHAVTAFDYEDDLSSHGSDIDILNATIKIIGIANESNNENNNQKESVQQSLQSQQQQQQQQQQSLGVHKMGNDDNNSSPKLSASLHDEGHTGLVIDDGHTEDTVSNSSDSDGKDSSGHKKKPQHHPDHHHHHAPSKEMVASLQKLLHQQRAIPVVGCLVVWLILLLACLAIVSVVCLPSKTYSNVHAPPSPPSSPPSSSLNEVDTWLNRILLPRLSESSLTAIGMPDTPQSRARAWLAADPYVLQYPDERIIQRYAMATLYYATQGEHWTRSDQWLSTTVHECHWFTKHNNNDNNFYNSTVCGDIHNNSSETLILLDLNSNNLNGTLPDDLSLLTFLRELTVYSNNMQGELPSTLGQMHQLETLNMFFNYFSGSIPFSIWNMPSLVYLDVGSNLLNGSLPDDWGVGISQIQSVFLDKNKLEGSIPTTVGHLVQLKSLELQENNLTGSLPTELSDCSNLVDLSVQQNHFNGTIPSELGILANLTEIRLFSNSFTGTMPSEICQGHSIPVFQIDCKSMACTCCTCYQA